MIEALNSFDRSLFLVINSWNAEWLNPLMVFISSQIIWIPFIFFMLFMAFIKLDKKHLALFVLFLLLAVVASDVTSSYIIKNIFQRLRPCRVIELKELMNNFGQKCGGKFGFVSSHAANSICLMVFTFLSLNIQNKKFHLIWILPILVCFSRIYLGVHYPGDIIGGVVIGSLWGGILGLCFRGSNLRSKSA